MTAATTMPIPHTLTRTRPFVLTLMCPDRPAVVRAVSDSLVRHGGSIVESQQVVTGDAERPSHRGLPLKVAQ
jgi:formyltetrahydrofolate hydrolase